MAILNYAHDIERTLHDALTMAAEARAEREADKEDLQEKYERHLPVHDSLDRRIDGIEDRYRAEHRGTQ